MARRFGELLFAITTASACSTHGSSSPGGPAADASAPPPSLSCPAGLTPASDGQGCVELAAPDPCPPGTGPFLGSTSCQPVGWTSACPAVMQPDPSGWGCIEIVSRAQCSNTTTERLGETGCVPVGDCSAPFPPSNATLFVSPSSTPDATHFQTIAAALAQASAGAVIAVDAGTYADSLEATIPLTVIGRCASQVILQNGMTGLYVTAKGVSVQGITLTGHDIGVAVEGGGSLALTDSIVLGNSEFGVYVQDPSTAVTLTRVRVAGTTPSMPGAGDGWGIELYGGSSITLTDCAVVGNTTVGIGGVGQVTATGTFISGQVLDDPPGDGFGIQLTGGKLSLSQCAITDAHSSSVSLGNSGTTATISECVLRGTVPDSSGVANGLTVLDSAHADVTSSAITEMAADCVLAAVHGSASITSSVLRGPLPARAGTWGSGPFAEQDGQIEVSGSAIVGTTGVGVGALDKGTTVTVSGSLISGTLEGTEGVAAVAQSNATLSLTGSSIIDTNIAGVTAGTDVGPGTVNVTGTLIRDTHVDAKGNGGDGAQAAPGSTLTLTDSAVVGSEGVGVSVGGVGATATIQSSVIRETAVLPTVNMFGYGVLGSALAVITVQSSYVRDNPGVGLTFSDSSGSIEGSWIAANGIGIAAQDGSSLSEGADAGSSLAPGEVFVSTDTTFSGNGTRVGSSEVPLPPAVIFSDGGVTGGGP
jgi:hypothetical protein